MASQQLSYQQSLPISGAGMRNQAFPSQNVNIIPPPSMGSAPQGTGPGQTSTPPQQKEVSTASLCRLGQEIVQEIVQKTSDLFSILKVLQLPNGTPQSLANQRDRKEKIQELVKNISILYKRLRFVYDKCNENCTGMEYTHIESLIPLKDEPDSKLEERKTTEVMKYTSEEHREIAEQVIQKNKHFKEIIDLLRGIIWEINTMLCMRRP